MSHPLCRGTHRSHLSFFKSIILLGAILFSPVLASAQTEEEMQTLQMYFTEDELVLSPTRTLKPISKVAENMSIVTAEEIRAMNTHMLSKVLERVTGLYIYHNLNDYGTSEFVFVQGSDFYSDDRRTLVLLDGMPWNFLAGGTHSVNTIPVIIIRRIEIIKGPASSAWGSSLGGVINIVTKDTGDKAVPLGSVSASYGERDSQNYNGEIMGSVGKVGYYLHADRTDSDGLRGNRHFERDSLYSKFDVSITPKINVTLTAGYSDPHFKYWDNIDYDSSSYGAFRAFFATAALTAEITDNLSAEALLYRFRQKFVMEQNVFSTGDTLYSVIYDETTEGGTIKLFWNDSVHNAVAGLDMNHGALDQISRSSGSDDEINHPGISKWALFINDTISIGNLSITPGLRHDQNNVSGDFTSPSLGFTYRIGSRTVLRASVARGFAYPPISFTSSEEVNLKPNPDLKPEKVWSYQAGAESVISDFLKVKTVLFHHDMKNEIQYTSDDITYIGKYVNGDGKAERTGAELELETAPVYKVSLKTGLSYVHKELVPEENFPDSVNVTNIYDCNIIVRYDDPKSLSAQLSGNYTWWDFDWESKYNTFIWDMSVSKRVYSSEKISSDVFLNVNNIFNSSYNNDASSDSYSIPRRWVEAGVRLEF